MAPPSLTVAPESLHGAGTAVLTTSGSVAHQLTTLQGTLAGCGGMCGDDPAGIVLAHSTDQTTHALIQALVDVVNGTARLGDAVKASASNYSQANRGSNVGHPATAPIQFPTATPHITATFPPSPEGGAGEPGIWKAVESLIGMVWPNGEPAKLRAAATGWRRMANNCHTSASQLAAPAATVDLQKIPEAPSMDDLLTRSTKALNDAGGLCTGLAARLEQYAGHIEDVHHKLLDLAKRIANPESLGSEVVSFFTGSKGDIDKIIDDIKTVLGNFGNEVLEVDELIASYIVEALAISAVMARMLGIILMQVVVAPVYNGVATLVNAGASAVNIVRHDPMAAGTEAAGAILAAAGVVTFGAGAVGDATVVGAPVGLVANAAGAAMVGGGAAIMDAGAQRLAQAAAQPGVMVSPMSKMSTGGESDPAIGSDGTSPRYSGDLAKVNKPDPAADQLADRIGGTSRVRFGNDPSAREFDSVSDDYVAQSKPANYSFNKSGRDQAKATFEAAEQSGRSVYYHFDGDPSASTVAKLNEYSERYDVPVVIDTAPLE